MFDWLSRKNKKQTMPEYSAVRETPNRGMPTDLVEQQAGKAYKDRRDAFANWLVETPQCPEPEKPLFVEILASNYDLLTIKGPEDDSLCLPIFTTPFRAGDYGRTLLDSATSHQYLSSSPRELVGLLRDTRQAGIQKFVLDRCPRCNVFCAIHSESVTTVADVITCWSVFKATELARMDLYLTYAQAAARADALYTAREVLLETAGHVSFEDPRLHVLLGQVAAALHDRDLFLETRAFLQFFQLKSWERRLDEIVQSGSRNFDFEFET
jgi:hypothetical protein